MDADERLTGLKRAYADIILNMAKEAAARIMSSERKAVRCQHELKVAKEEALGMLLRLKQLMDCKISEAELTSLSQQRKIEELEAQLQEAEDIVSDLRVELREVQAELERVTSCKEKEVQTLEEDDTAAPGQLPGENRLVLPPESQESLTVLDTKVMDLKPTNQGYQSCSKIVQILKPQVAVPDLPSIILRSKVPELYRNGCTQRIRACEGNLLDGELSVSKRVEKIENENGDGVDEGISSAPIHKVDDVVNPQEHFQQADDLLSSWHLLKRKRRRAMRNRKADYSSSRSSPEHVMNNDKTSNTGGLKANSSPARDCSPGEDHSEMGLSLSLENLSLEKAEPDVNVGLPEMYGNEQESAETPVLLNSTVGDELVMAKIDSPRQESRSLESVEEVPVDRTDLENVSSQLVNSKSKTSDVNDGVPSHTLNDRVIKYTFQRKRKREPLSVSEENTPFKKSSTEEINGEKLNGHLEPVPEENAPFEKSSTKEIDGGELNGHLEPVSEENAPFEKSSTKEIDGEELNGYLDPIMSSPVTESSRDSRRMAQVARQLISLSEKKWWQ